MTVPHSTRAGAALLSGERGTTTRRALEWLRGTDIGSKMAGAAQQADAEW